MTNSGARSYITSGLSSVPPVLAAHQKQLEDIFVKLDRITNDISDISSDCQLKDVELTSTVKNNSDLLIELKHQITSINNKISSIELDISRFKELEFQIGKRKDADAAFYRNIFSGLLVVGLTIIVVNPIVNNMVNTKTTVGK